MLKNCLVPGLINLFSLRKKVTTPAAMFTGTARVCGVLAKLRHGCRSLKAARVAGYQAVVCSAKIMLVKSAVFTLQVYCVLKTQLLLVFMMTVVYLRVSFDHL